MNSAQKLPTSLVPGPVAYRVLTPPTVSQGGLPLLLCLHGGMGGHAFFDMLAPIIGDMWLSGALPALVAVAPETGHSFYLDYRDGSEQWERFIVDELLPHLEACHGVSPRSSATLVCGISMGGLGALRLGIKHCERFGGSIAWEPAIEPAVAWRDVRLDDRFWRSADVMEARFGKPLDEDYWAANNPATLAHSRAQAIRDSGTKIYLEVGTDDVYGLFKGAEFLHRTLYELDIRHEYRCVLGADHIGASLPARLRDGLAFCAKVLDRTAPDARVARLRDLVAMQRRRAGLA